MNVGILGGSFDPVHTGHLILAEQCRIRRKFDQIWLMPTAASPFKPQGARATAKQRVEMLQLAIAGNDHFAVSQIEIDRGGTSFTVETLRQLHNAHPENQWTWIMGSDSLSGFPNWREPQAIAELADVLVYLRPQNPIDWSVLEGCVSSETINHWRTHAIETLQIEISSTLLRERVVRGESIRYLTPRAVEKLIETSGLYRAE